MNSSPSLYQLMLIPEHQRDAQWENRVLQALPTGRLELIHPAAQQGADSWPYLFCRTLDGAAAGEPAHQILSWLSERGIGLALNPEKPAPDFVLTYGMIWNFRTTGFFISNRSMQTDRSIEFVENQKVLAGPPSDSYLPPYVRSVLREFFTQQGVLNPRIMVVSRDLENYDLCFSIESLGNPSSNEHPQILEALSWFLPGHYSLALLPESAMKTFVDL